MLKAGKIQLVEDLTSDLKSAKSIILVNYAGLNVVAQQELKHRLNAVGGRMVVVKNTLLKRAAEAIKMDKDVLTDDILSGQTAIVIATDDAVAPIQVLGKFAKEFEFPKFKVGVVEGSFQNNASLIKISTLPSKETLYAQLVGSLMSPMYELTGTLNGNLQKLVYILDAKSKMA